MLNWLTAQHLVGLPGMPTTVQGVNARAKREGWEAQLRLGRGGGQEYSFAVLPKETQTALLMREVAQQEPAPAQQLQQPGAAQVVNSPKRDAYTESRLNDDQRSVMAARMVLIREIERMSKVVSQQRAIDTLVGLARTGSLSPYLAERAERANDRKNADRALSERTLKRWLADYRKHGEIALAPARRKPNMSVPVWAADFLKHYQRPQKPSAQAAYLAFQREYPGAPSLHAVQRFLAKLSPQAREMGRMGPREAKALLPYNKRLTDHMWPNDVWVADGHKFDAEVINPNSGQIFRPEVTSIIDWATRRIVGFAINVAESTLATLDALHSGISRVGMFRVFYVDNGSGFANDTIREVVERLGGEMTHSLPYNSQARGVIERAHRTIMVRLAKDFDSYIGADMDGEAGNKVHRISRADLKKGSQPRHIPTLNEFYERLAIALDEYNHSPHRGLTKIRDSETGRFRHPSPMEAWRRAEAEGFAALQPSTELSMLLVRPQDLRRTHRGLVRTNGANYFLQDLVPLHGDQVRVAWDYRDASKVAVFTLDGDLIGQAILDGNASDAMPRIVKDQDRRVSGQLAKLVQKGKTLTGKDVELRVIERPAEDDRFQQHLLEAEKFVALAHEPEADALEAPDNEMTRYDRWQQLDSRQRLGEALSDDEARWHASYPNHPDFKSIQRMYDHFEAEQARA
ncbi:DNA-binding protein [Pseudomonas extremaustralis]|nr:DNA-binding protein [Pseudomonas extremaustralis]MDB1109742.1 DNA-binding protein [Pseudomonas extremaustralis]